ncbi:MAG: S41 family peptidase [Cyclobacteriaceae bacterium]|uniref:S41 family peptidase n=1 Tax=Fulvivirga sp. TaxID=1931237 RepID=UPI0032EF03F3
MKKIPSLLLLCTFIFGCNPKEYKFELTDFPKGNLETIGIRGNTPPLSWDKTLFMKADEIDNSLFLMIQFPDSTQNIEYKFVIDDGENIIWETIENRNEILNDEDFIFKSEWNIEKLIDPTSLPKLTVAQLQQDVDVIKNAVIKTHPGLYRYNDSITIQNSIDELEKSIQNPLTYGEFFLSLSKFIATIQCDHTYASYWNQQLLMNNVLHRQREKVPFTFRWINGKMIVKEDVTDTQKLALGTEILTINNVNVSDILDGLLPYINTDGGTIHNKIADAEVNGYKFRYSAFDVLFPLLFPSNKKVFALKIMSLDNETHDIVVQKLTSDERNIRLIKKYPEFPKNPSDLWEYKILEKDIGYFKIGSFETDNFDKSWEQMMEDAFHLFDSVGVNNLIIDIRENEGGIDDAGEKLKGFILKRPCKNSEFVGKTRFLEFPEEVKNYITTWDNWFYDLKKENYKEEPGYYVFPDAFTRPHQPNNHPYQGKLVLLTSAKNVSGGFYLAKLFQECSIGLIVGQETGGNQNGINGGAILFLKPPNSKINIDLPIMGSFSKKKMPDKGVVPDFIVEKNKADIINGVDTELRKAMEIILKDK